MDLLEATINALMGINEAKGSNKTYTCIEDRQHGDFCVGETMTAEEWGKTAMGWADNDGWTNPDEPLLQNFKTEQDCINFIDDMWEITLVPSDSPEAKEFLGEARSHKEDNEKVAPRDRKQSFEGGPNKLSNKASGIAINDEDTAETGVNRISVGKHKGEIIGRDIKRDRVRSAEQALNRRNAGPLDFAGENDMLHFEVSPNERSAKYRKEHGMVTRENKELNETFTIDTFNNKYKPLYDNSVTVKDNVVSADNILLRGSGIPKRVSATLNNNDLRIDNENIDIVYDGNNIKTSGQYWFTSNMEDDEKFATKVTNAVKNLYNDMKKLQGTTEVNNDNKVEEKENLNNENEVNPEADKLIKDYYAHKMDLPELHKALINLFGNKIDAFKYLANNDLRVKNKKLENIQSNHQGICPKCGSVITDYGQIFWDDEGIGQEFNCTNPKCKAHGIEYYNTTFDYIEVEDN